MMGKHMEDPHCKCHSNWLSPMCHDLTNKQIAELEDELADEKSRNVADEIRRESEWLAEKQNIEAEVADITLQRDSLMSSNAQQTEQVEDCATCRYLGRSIVEYPCRDCINGIDYDGKLSYYEATAKAKEAE